jgi:hypothetical protein
MKKKIQDDIPRPRDLRPYSLFCGARVGEISQRTEEMTHAIYDCPKCDRYYCGQCSYNKDGFHFQFCLRCDSKIKKVM